MSAEQANSSKLSVFFNLAKTEGAALKLTVTSFDVMTDGQWLALHNKPFVIDTKKIGNSQALLFRRTMSSGAYQRFRMVIEKVDLTKDDKSTPVDLEKHEFEVQLDEPISLATVDSQSIFISLDLKSSLVGTNIFQPKFSIISSQKNHLLKDLAVVACPDINTLYFIRTDTNWIYSSIGISGRPTYLVSNVLKNILYVLAADEAKIKAIEISSGRLIDSIQIPMGVDPVFMTVSPDGEWVYILDGRSDYLIRMHLPSGNLSGRVRLANRPKYILYLQEQGKLAVSLELSQAVVLLDAVSLETIDTIQVNTSPKGLAAKDSKLYVAGSSTNMVTVYDLSERKIQKQINVGFFPQRFAVTDNRLFVSNYMSNSVSVLIPFLNSTKRELLVGKRPLEMAFSKDWRWLYVGDENPGGISVIDVTTEKTAGYISLGTTPGGLVVVQQ